MSVSTIVILVALGMIYVGISGWWATGVDRRLTELEKRLW